MLGKVAAKGADHPPHLLRDLPLGGDGMDLHGRGQKARQQHEQSTGGDIFFYFTFRLQRNPLPCQGELAQGQDVVAQHPGLGLDLVGLPLLGVLGIFRPNATFRLLSD